MYKELDAGWRKVLCVERKRKVRWIEERRLMTGGS
jgi:hypothetical protein